MRWLLLLGLTTYCMAQPLPIRIGCGDLFEQFPVRLGVGTHALPLITGRLHAARPRHPRCNFRRSFGGRWQTEVRRAHRRDIDMQVDPVQ